MATRGSGLLRRLVYWIIGGLVILSWFAAEDLPPGRDPAPTGASVVAPSATEDQGGQKPAVSNDGALRATIKDALRSAKIIAPPSATTVGPTDGSAKLRPEQAQQDVYVTASALRLRVGPGTSYGQMGSFSRGSHLQFAGEHRGAWMKVESDGVVGWMHSDYLSFDVPAQALPKVEVPQRAATPQVDHAAIKRRIIRESIASYPGSCPCPYNTDRAGRRCGGRSAYSRPGGRAPLCYEHDISEELVAAWR